MTDNQYKEIIPSPRCRRDDFFDLIIKQFIQRRKQLGLSQADVDYRMGTADRLCSKWECGVRIPTSFNFFCWAQALEASLILIPEEGAH